MFPKTKQENLLNNLCLGSYGFALCALCVTILTSSLARQREQSDRNGASGTAGFKRLCGISAQRAFELSLLLDTYAFFLIPVAFVCFCTVVLTPKLTPFEIVGVIVGTIVSFVFMSVLVILIVFAMRR